MLVMSETNKGEIDVSRELATTLNLYLECQDSFHMDSERMVVLQSLEKRYDPGGLGGLWALTNSSDSPGSYEFLNLSTYLGGKFTSSDTRHVQAERITLANGIAIHESRFSGADRPSVENIELHRLLAAFNNSPVADSDETIKGLMTIADKMKIRTPQDWIPRIVSRVASGNELLNHGDKTNRVVRLLGKLGFFRR